MPLLLSFEIDSVNLDVNLNGDIFPRGDEVGAVEGEGEGDGGTGVIRDTDSERERGLVDTGEEGNEAEDEDKGEDFNFPVFISLEGNL